MPVGPWAPWLSPASPSSSLPAGAEELSLIARLGEQEAVRKEWVTTHAQVAASAGCSSCFTHSANYSIHSCGYVYICGCVCVCACVLRVYLCVHRHAVYVSMCTCLCAVNTHMRMCMCAYMVRACYVLAGPGAPSRACLRWGVEQFPCGLVFYFEAPDVSAQGCMEY